MENSETINLDESNFDREINGDKPVLVDFWAEWCGPCKLIAPLLDEIAREKADSVKIAKVNVDQNQSLSFKYNIRAIPSLLFFKNGQLRDQVTGISSAVRTISASRRNEMCCHLEAHHDLGTVASSDEDPRHRRRSTLGDFVGAAFAKARLQPGDGHYQFPRGA